MSGARCTCGKLEASNLAHEDFWNVDDMVVSSLRPVSLSMTVGVEYGARREDMRGFHCSRRYTTIDRIFRIVSCTFEMNERLASCMSVLTADQIRCVTRCSEMG